PHDLNGSPARRRRREHELQLVSGEDEKAILIGPTPIRERTSVYTNEDGTVGFDYRICPKVRDGSLGRGFVFLPGTLQAVVDRKWQKIRTHDGDYVMPTIEHGDTFWLWTEQRDSIAIRAHGFNGNKRPGSKELLLG